MFLLLKELSPPDGLPARTHPLGRGVFNETPSPNKYKLNLRCAIIDLLKAYLVKGNYLPSIELGRQTFSHCFLDGTDIKDYKYGYQVAETAVLL